MPWDPKYRKAGVKGITANAIDVVIETGDSGPITPVGINLPNDQDVREQHGSKSVSLSNVNEAYDKSSSTGFSERVLLDAGGGRARGEVGQPRGRADDEHARGDRARVRPDRREAEGQARGRHQGVLLGARGGPRGSGRACTSSPIRSWSNWASCRRPITRTSCSPSTKATRATRWCSCAASARARRSRKTTCATAR